MKIVTKEINPEGSEFIVYVMDEGNSPITCSLTNADNKNELINRLSSKYEISNEVEEMNYNKYITQ